MVGISSEKLIEGYVMTSRNIAWNKRYAVVTNSQFIYQEEKYSNEIMGIYQLADCEVQEKSCIRGKTIVIQSDNNKGTIHVYVKDKQNHKKWLEILQQVSSSKKKSKNQQILAKQEYNRYSLESQLYDRKIPQKNSEQFVGITNNVQNENLTNQSLKSIFTQQQRKKELKSISNNQNKKQPNEQNWMQNEVYQTEFKENHKNEKQQQSQNLNKKVSRTSEEKLQNIIVMICFFINKNQNHIIVALITILFWYVIEYYSVYYVKYITLTVFWFVIGLYNGIFLAKCGGEIASYSMINSWRSNDSWVAFFFKLLMSGVFIQKLQYLPAICSITSSGLYLFNIFFEDNALLFPIFGNLLMSSVIFLILVFV